MALTKTEFFKLWWDAAIPHAITKTRAAGFFITVFSGPLAALIPWFKPYRDTLTWAAPLALLAVYSLYRMAAAPYQIYAEKHHEAEAFREQLTDYQNHQALADELTERYTFATHQLLNRINREGPAPNDWLIATDEWRRSVLEILERYNCTRQEITHFEVINQFEMAQYDYAMSKAMFLIRVGRLSDLSTKHANSAEQRKLAPK